MYSGITKKKRTRAATIFDYAHQKIIEATLALYQHFENQFIPLIPY